MNLFVLTASLCPPRSLGALLLYTDEAVQNPRFKFYLLSDGLGAIVKSVQVPLLAQNSSHHWLERISGALKVNMLFSHCGQRSE